MPQWSRPMPIELGGKLSDDVLSFRHVPIISPGHIPGRPAGIATEVVIVIFVNYLSSELQR